MNKNNINDIKNEEGDNNMAGIISPTYDFMAKRLLFDEKDKDVVLKKLLQDCIEFDDKKLEHIELVDRMLDREDRDDKLAILDVNARLSDGTEVNIEVQVSDTKDYRDRTAYYSAKRLVAQGQKGMMYDEFNEVVSLNIVDYVQFEETEKAYTSFTLKEETENILLSDLIRIDFLELPKALAIDKSIDNKKLLWAKFFKAETSEELQEIVNQDATFKEPVNKLMNLSLSPKLQELEFLKQKTEWHKQAREDLVYDNGVKQGIEQGIERRDNEIILNMLNNGMDINSIASILNIESEKIEKVNKELEHNKLGYETNTSNVMSINQKVKTRSNKSSIKKGFDFDLER